MGIINNDLADARSGYASGMELFGSVKSGDISRGKGKADFVAMKGFFLKAAKRFSEAAKLASGLGNLGDAEDYYSEAAKCCSKILECNPGDSAVLRSQEKYARNLSVVNSSGSSGTVVTVVFGILTMAVLLFIGVGITANVIDGSGDGEFEGRLLYMAGILIVLLGGIFWYVRKKVGSGKVDKGRKVVKKKVKGNGKAGKVKAKTKGNMK
jgi:hypothetical protein